MSKKYKYNYKFEIICFINFKITNVENFMKKNSLKIDTMNASD